jgi:hypothetical protein
MSEAEITLRFRQFCLLTSSTMGGSEKFRSTTQNKKSEQNPKITWNNNEAVYVQKIFICYKVNWEK